MTNKSGAIGTLTESGVVNYLKSRGIDAERRRLRGVLDAGDIFGLDGCLVEVKGGDAAENASDNQIDAWLDNLYMKVHREGLTFGVLVVKRYRQSPKNPEKFWAITLEKNLAGTFTVRYYLRDFVTQYLAGCFSGGS